MVLKFIFLEEFGKAFVPKKHIPNIRKYVLKAGIKEVPYKFFGFLFYISLAITILLYVLFTYPYIKSLSILKIYIYSFLIVLLFQLALVTILMLVVYFYLDLKIFVRTKNMENQLADFIQVVSSNIRGGMTFEQGLWKAISPRFEVLGSEIANVSKKVMMGYDVKTALIEFSEKYDSLMLKRVIDLIMSELESGGNIADLLDRVVEKLKETKALKDDMSAAITSQVIFISIIVIVLSPLLFALSFYLLTILIKFVSRVAQTSQGLGTISLSMSKNSINPEDYKRFSLLANSVIALFSSLIVAIVEKGNIKSGVKYIPIYVSGSILFYFIFLKVFGAIFLAFL